MWAERLHAHPELPELFLVLLASEQDKTVRKMLALSLKNSSDKRIKLALKKLRRRDYSKASGATNLSKDIAAVEAIDGLSAVRYAKYVFIKNPQLSEAKRYFWQHASDEALQFYFVHNSFWNGKPNEIALATGNGAVSARVARQLWASISQVASQLRSVQLDCDDSFAVTEIPEAPKLRSLDISGAFDKVPASLIVQPRLARIVLRSDELRRLPDISEAVALRRLEIHAPLETWPPGLFSLDKLERLRLSNTQLAQLPAQVSGLASLERLSLANNPRLNEVPPVVYSLPKLDEFDKETLRAQNK